MLELCNLLDRGQIRWDREGNRLQVGRIMNLTGVGPNIFGLHVGHVNGSINPALSANGSTIFLINDLYACPLDYVFNLIIQASALAPGKFVFVRKSALRDRQARLREVLFDLLSIRRLKRLSFIKRRSEELLFVRDYVLPIEQVTDIISLQARSIFANRDNYQFVELAAEARKKLSITLNAELPAFSLSRPAYAYVTGTDGRKMAFANSNGVYIFSSEEQLRSAIHMARTGLVDPLSRRTENNPIFQYANVLRVPFSDDEIRSYEGGSIGDFQIKTSFLERWFRKRHSLIESFIQTNEAVKLLEEGEEHANRILDQFYTSWHSPDV